MRDKRVASIPAWACKGVLTCRLNETDAYRELLKARWFARCSYTSALYVLLSLPGVLVGRSTFNCLHKRAIDAFESCLDLGDNRIIPEPIHFGFQH